ncbi:7677_t:CDS:2 [Rhizophagus irregularis]|nr:7677_t:CDS:2 [Rhizophagus irregularis]
MAEQPSQKIDKTTCEGFPKTVECSINHVEGNERYGCRIEGEKYENNETSEYCPNATRIRSLHMALGELKGGSLEPMHKMPAEGGGLNESCRSCNSSPMVIEVIANEYEHNLFASYINHGPCEVSNLNCIKPGSNLEDYVNEVQEYGFNHIILIGVREHGIIFLNCYGRLFILDTMTGVLWPLGDTLDEAVTKPWTGELAWNVDEAGTIFEVEYCMYTSLGCVYHDFT